MPTKCPICGLTLADPPKKGCEARDRDTPNPNAPHSGPGKPAQSTPPRVNYLPEIISPEVQRLVGGVG